MISVIVPVYSIEPYLKQCEESILCQTYKQQRGKEDMLFVSGNSIYTENENY